MNGVSQLLDRNKPCAIQVHGLESDSQVVHLFVISHLYKLVQYRLFQIGHSFVLPEAFYHV